MSMVGCQNNRIGFPDKDEKYEKYENSEIRLQVWNSMLLH